MAMVGLGHDWVMYQTKPAELFVPFYLIHVLHYYQGAGLGPPQCLRAPVITCKRSKRSERSGSNWFWALLCGKNVPEQLESAGHFYNSDPKDHDEEDKLLKENLHMVDN